MFHIEFDLNLKRNYKKKYIVGVDEAGRGPLAGPVVACAAIISDYNIPTLNEVKDSKKLSPSKREEIFNSLIKNDNFLFSIGYSTHQEIDTYNILNATLIAMKRALDRLLRSNLFSYDEVLIVIDGNRILDGLNLPQLSIVKADSKSAVVGCSSIFAKVIRDRWMDYYHKIYPQYNFKRHKGYPTKAHIEAIERFGYSPIHRKTFKGCKSLVYE